MHTHVQYYFVVVYFVVQYYFVVVYFVVQYYFVVVYFVKKRTSIICICLRFTILCK